jgi:hypothetical protein
MFYGLSGTPTVYSPMSQEENVATNLMKAQQTYQLHSPVEVLLQFAVLLIPKRFSTLTLLTRVAAMTPNTWFSPQRRSREASLDASEYIGEDSNPQLGG